MPRIKPGEKVDVTIKGVQFEHAHTNGPVTIRDEEGYCYSMPPQAAITRPGEAPGNPISSVMSLLDGMEEEGIVPPYVTVAVRKKLGLPPKHWPPQAGDVWNDGDPWSDSLWFARQYKADDHNEDWPSRIVMTSAEGGRSIKSPQDLLDSAAELTLVYRRDERR